MLFPKHHEYPSDGLNVFASPVRESRELESQIFVPLICILIQMEESTNGRFSMRKEDSGVSDKEYSMWFAGH